MSDSIHAILFIIICGAIILLFIYLMDIIGLFIGFLVGRAVAGFVVSRLPGFWENKR